MTGTLVVIAAEFQPDGQPGLQIYKIGITSNPRHRFYNFTFGYIHEGYTSMDLLACTTPKWAAALEVFLIDECERSWQGCQNTLRGGQSVPPSPPVFVYVCFATVEQITAFRLAKARAAYARLEDGAFQHV